MKKMLKKMIALMAALAVVLSVPTVCMADPEEGAPPKPPVFENWDDNANRN